MPELLATCWTHAGQALPIDGRHLSPLPLRARAEAAARAGFTGIGFTIDDLDAAAPALTLSDVRRLCDDLGLVHTEVELLADWWATGDRRARSDEKRARLLHAASVLCARQIKIAPDAPTDPMTRPVPVDRDRWAAELHNLARQAADSGTRVALEVLPFSNLPDFTDTAGLIAAADHPAAGLVVDIWHVERGPSTLAELAALPPGMVFAVELNDAPAEPAEPVRDLFQDTIHHRVLPGDGAFDIKGLIRTLQGVGFTGPWGVEIISDAHRARPLDEAMDAAYRATMAQFE